MAKTDPLNGKLVVVTGGSGFLGQYVAQALLERGARVRIASRNPEKAHPLKPLANLGQLQFARFDLRNPASRKAAVHGVDAVVNLVGSFDGDLVELMGRDAGRLATVARDAGAGAFVQVSAIGSDEASEVDYARAKAMGEQLVLEAFPKATVLRPSILFGKDDNFLNMFAGLIAKLPALPVFGPDAALQPVFVDDVAEAVATALADRAAHGGKTYELGGPEVLTMMELNRRIAAAQERKRYFLAVPDAVTGVFAALPGTPMSRDQWALLKAGSVVSPKVRGFDKLGIAPRPLGLYLDRWMVRYKRHGRFTGRSRTA